MWSFKRVPLPEAKALATPRDNLYALFGLVPTTAMAIPITPESALRVPAVGSAIRVVSEPVSCLDVLVKRIEADGIEIAYLVSVPSSNTVRVGTSPP